MINLLPPKEKQILLQEKQFREVLILGTTFLLLLSFFALILFLIRVDLRSKLLSQKEALEQRKKELKIVEIRNIEKEIGSLNQNLLKVASFYEDKFYLTDILEDLSEAMPSGLYLTNLSCNKEEREISISGFSPDRETLTVFKRNLESKEDFKEVYFPPSNWIEPINIDFFASFKIDNK